jgi:hypothetical protein
MNSINCSFNRFSFLNELLKINERRKITKIQANIRLRNCLIKKRREKEVAYVCTHRTISIKFYQRSLQHNIQEM